MSATLGGDPTGAAAAVTVSQTNGKAPAMRQPVSMLHTGPVNLATQAAITHPLEAAERLRPEKEVLGKIRVAGDIVGPGAAGQLAMDVNRLNARGLYRLPVPGMKTEAPGLDTLLGRDETLTMADMLGGLPGGEGGCGSLGLDGPAIGAPAAHHGGVHAALEAQGF